MTLLADATHLENRKAVAATSLVSLAGGLRSELTPILADLPDVPREKALLSRAGGRCTIDGALVRFDPFDPRHICPQCGREYAGGLHDRFRLYWYQLWLAERVANCAMLGVLLDDAACRDAAASLLDRYADQYLRYPNADNVLGPSRPFFSTYLESIWLLQLMIALDALEVGAPSAEVASLGARVRDRLIAPSAALIAGYDEGMSNRQVWNNAALMAASRLMDDRVRFDRTLHGPSGLHAHLETALLSDGSWYEGENYHLFAHRGLWYGAVLAERGGSPLPSPLNDRFHEGFVAPFRTLLPDLTYPSRRDSQYAVSVRQPRFAESCELGLADRDDDRLTGMLARLYDPAMSRSETGRVASSGDVERNLAATALTRADLSWRSLLFARPTLPPLVVQPLRSDLLPAQGLGILRRNDGTLYVSLDYGHSGGGHGHPDRLNLSLADGAHRWFDDPGTGSYVDASLHWYRSTLAHNAPLVDGHSQPRVHGELLAYEDNDHAGWISARAELAPGLMVRRSVIAMDDYLVDHVEWEGTRAHEIALPIHNVEIRSDVIAVVAPVEGGTDIEDGFAFLSDGKSVEHEAAEVISLRGDDVGHAQLTGWVFAPGGTVLSSATAPAVPGKTARTPLVLLRKAAQVGAFLAAWSWTDAIDSVDRDDDSLVVHRRDGTTHRHRSSLDGWRVELADANGKRQLNLAGLVDQMGETPATERTRNTPRSVLLPRLHSLPTSFELGEGHYRRSEFTWEGAGGPRANVTVTRQSPRTVGVTIDVPFSNKLFVPLTTENQLDNEPASINGDSVQLYAISGSRTAGLLLVPDVSSVSMRPVDGWNNELSVDAKWRPTSDGYHLEATLYLDGRTPEFALDVIINDVVPGRARRRGQLVLSGAHGEFVYLRGDRQDSARLLRFSIEND